MCFFIFVTSEKKKKTQRKIKSQREKDKTREKNKKAQSLSFYLCFCLFISSFVFFSALMKRNMQGEEEKSQKRQKLVNKLFSGPMSATSLCTTNMLN